MPNVYFEPIEEEIECGDEETVLDAAFRQGYALVYGCREGQCSACKAYLLSGEVALKRHSSFALSETEQEQGYTLLCRAMPDEDLEIELLHVDPDNYRLDFEISDGSGVVEEIERLTDDIRRLVLRIDEPADFQFRAGGFVDLHVPGDADERRSFSIANLPGEGRIELIIKCYPGGKVSGQLEDGAIAVGDELGFTGPYGSFYLRECERPIVMVAGGSGMAPVLGLLRQMATQEPGRPVRFFYGARTRADLFYSDLIAELGGSIADFEYIPVLSEPTAECGWNGVEGFVHEAVGEFVAAGTLGDPGGLDIYACGPPPLIDAATEMLIDGHGVPDERIFYDKFTTSSGSEQAEE